MQMIIFIGLYWYAIMQIILVSVAISLDRKTNVY